MADLAARWWDEYVDAGRVEAATRTSYKTAMRRIIESIGTVDAHELTTPTLIRWHASLGVSPRAANITLTALSSMMQRGVEWGMLAGNPCRGVKRHRESTATVHIPTPDEIARLGMTAPTDRERGMLLVAGYAGLRQGELRALAASDLYHGRIRVRRAVGADGKFKTPKTHEQRVVPIPGSVREWLAEYLADHAARDLMFARSDGRPLDRNVWRREVWLPWTVKAGCEGLMWRHLRHFYASTVSAVGASVLQASRWMGHSTITTTLDRYGFLFDADEDRVMERLERR